MIILKSDRELAYMRDAGKIVAETLVELKDAVKPGVSTLELDKIAEKYITSCGAKPAFKGYHGFPSTICASVNEEVVHGIPGHRKLKDGDIINVDVSTNLNGYFSDSSRMFCIGNVSEENRKLVEETKNAVYEGLKQVKPWGFLGDMGQAVNDYVKSKGYSVVREVGGHGIGLEFHEDPWVSYISKKGTEMLMVPGMIFTIEPMVNAGKPDIFVDEDNGWTIYTEDNSMSAQWEIQVLVTEDGYEIIAY